MYEFGALFCVMWFWMENCKNVMQKNTLIKMKLQDVNIVVEDKPWTSVIFINAKGKALQIKCTGFLF